MSSLPMIEKPMFPVGCHEDCHKRTIRRFHGRWTVFRQMGQQRPLIFLRLFQRIGKRFTGLLLLELGWSVLLLTVKKITPTLAFPILMRTVPFKVQTLTTGFVSVDVVQVLSVGGIIIFLFWIWYGGFYRYLSVPLIWLTRTLFLSVLTILVALVALALNISFLKDRLEKPIVLYYQIVKKMISIGRVAIAPIHSYTFDEEVYAAKAPPPDLCCSNNKVTHALGYLRTVKRVRFNFLQTYLEYPLQRKRDSLGSYLDQMSSCGGAIFQLIRQDTYKYRNQNN